MSKETGTVAENRAQTSNELDVRYQEILRLRLKVAESERALIKNVSDQNGVSKHKTVIH